MYSVTDDGEGRSKEVGLGCVECDCVSFVMFCAPNAKILAFGGFFGVKDF